MYHQTQPARRRAAVAVACVAGMFAAMSASGVASAAIASPAAAPTIRNADSAAAVPGRYIVVLKDSAVLRAQGIAERAHSLAEANSAEIGHIYEHVLTGFSATMSASEAQRMASDPEVDYVAQDQYEKVADDSQENPPSWGLDRIDHWHPRLNNVYSYENTGAGVNAYVIDTGIHASHTDFGGRAVMGPNFANGDTTYDDCNGHGTHVAGTIGGTKYGVAKGVRLVGVKVMSCAGTGYEADIIEGLDWVWAWGIRPAVVNISLGCALPAGSNCPSDTPKNTAINNLLAAGIPVVVAAGNDNRDACQRGLAGITAAIIVGAIDQGDTRRASSNWGTCLDLYAPGGNITSAWWTSNTDIRSISGTSMAAPHVAGVVAMMLARKGWGNVYPPIIASELILLSTKGILKNLQPGDPDRLLYSGAPPVKGSSSIAVARNADGRLVMHAVDANGNWTFATQAQAGGSTWGTWNTISDKYWNSVAARTGPDGRVYAVGLAKTSWIGNTHEESVWYTKQTAPNADSYINKTQFPAAMLTSAVLAKNADGHMELFGGNSWGEGWHIWETASGSGVWQSAWAGQVFPGKVRSVAAENNSTDLLQTFGLDNSGAIWTRWQLATGGWSAWQQIDGQLSTIATARNANGTIVLFGANKDGQVFRREQQSTCCNSWGPWIQMDGLLTSVAAATNSDGRVEFFGVNKDGQLWHRSQVVAGGQTWTDWQQLPATLRP